MPYLLSGWRLAVILTLALVVIGLVIWAYSGSGMTTQKEANLQVNVGIDQGKNAVVANLIANQEGVNRNAEVNRNAAVNALNESINRDSSTFGGGRAVDDRFCRDFPRDSSCRK